MDLGTLSEPTPRIREQSPAVTGVPVSSSGKVAYPLPAERPTQEGPHGIYFDFNEGCRVLLPAREVGRWRVRLTDRDTGNVLFESENAGALVRSSKRWFVRFGIEVWSIDDAPDVPPQLVMTHHYDARERDVMIQFPVGTLGDTLAWMPYAARFAERRGARVTCAMSGLILPLLRDAYPHINFVTHETFVAERMAERAYATYYIGLFFDDAARDHQPADFRLVGLHRTAAYILGVDPSEQPAEIVLPDDSRPIAEPYVCIAVQSSSGCKYWTNPTGWRDVVAFLKSRGFRVICIDQKPVHGDGVMWTHIPHGAEDETGDRPLTERARWLRHAAFFIGLSSGLSWLAWSAGCPVVLISGFTHPVNEFSTSWRVINWHACNSCWNDPKVRFDHRDFMWCPHHANTARQFECTRLITSAHVIGVLQTIPAVGTGDFSQTTQSHSEG